MKKTLRERTESDHAHGLEVGRLKRALDVSSASVIVSDETQRLIYAND